MYRLGGVDYPTKKAVHEKCAELFKRLGDITNVDDLRFVCELFMMHPNLKEKEAGGVHGFAVRRDTFGSRCFYVKQTDGDYLHFGHRTCLNGENPRRWVQQACRAAVLPDVLAYRDSLVWPRLCPITNEEIDRDNHHVDHAPPWTFDRILVVFLEERPDPPITDRGTPGQAYSLTNEADVAAFRELHNSRAVLRAVSVRANLSILRRGVK